ncbi:docking protein 2 [Cherax quadricarinatus]
MDTYGNKVKDGTLLFRTKGPFGKKLKEHHALLFGASDSGVARFELYETAKASVSGPSLLVIPASDIIKVKAFTGNTTEELNSFLIATKEQQYTFSTKDATEWVKAVQKTLLQPMQAQGQQQQQQRNSASNRVTVENDIYVSAEEICRLYNVTVSADTRQRLGVDGKVQLVVENGHITIVSLDGNRIVRWGIENLRRFGYTDDNFHLEAGRKTQFGEGEFVFLTNSGKQIHTLVSKEKEIARHNVTNKSQSVPPGQVLLPNTPNADQDMLTLGRHIYEELPIVKPAVSSTVVKDTRASSTGQKPDKPPRAVNTRSFETVVPGPQLPNLSPQKIMNFSYNNGHNSQANVPVQGKQSKTHTTCPAPGCAPDMLPAVKVLPKITGKYQPSTVSENAVYSEPMVYTEAWKEYSRNDDEVVDEPVNCEYDKLKHFTPSNKEVVRSHYECIPVSRPTADGARVEQILAIKQQKIKEEPIYSQVDMTKKKSSRKE